MTKTSMSDIWKKKINQVDTMINRIQSIIDKTAAGKSELLSDLYEEKTKFMGTKNSLTIAYMRCL